MNLQLQLAIEMLLDSGRTLESIRRTTETAAIRASLRNSNWAIGRAAILLGMHRNTLARRIRELHIELPPRKPPQPSPAEVSRECSRCSHTRSEHCTGGVIHPWREMSQGGAKAFIGCEYSHCNQVLCACVEFIPPGTAIPPLGTFLEIPYSFANLSPYA